MNENLQVDAEHEALIAFGNDGLKTRIEPVSSGHVLCPIELEDCRENELGIVDPGIDRVLSGSQRFLPDALVAGANQAAELEVCAGSVLCGQSDVGLDDGDLTLFDNQHRNLLHANQERVEVVSAIKQRVVLEADLSASLEELLEVLIVVVLIVLAAENQPHQLEISDAGFPFELADVLESAQPAGNSAGRQGLAVQCGDHSDHVDDFAAFAGRLGRNARDIELPLFKAEGAEVRACCRAASLLYSSDTGTPKTCGLVMTRKATG